MEATKIAEIAQALYASHGSKAEVEAAQKAKRCEDSGKNDEAETWRAVRRAISELRGAPES